MPTRHLCSDFSVLSLSKAQGILFWKTLRMLWLYRCEVRFRSVVPDLSGFICLLCVEVSKWLEMPQLSLVNQAVHTHLQGLSGWLSDRNIPVQLGSAVDTSKRPLADPLPPPGPCPYMARPLRWQEAGQKRARAQEGLAADESSPSNHIPEVYTDGSYAEEAPGVGFAGFEY